MATRKAQARRKQRQRERTKRQQTRQKQRSRRQEKRQRARNKRQRARQEARKQRQQTRQRQRTKRQAARQKTKQVRARQKAATKQAQYAAGFGPGSGVTEVIQGVGGVAAPLAALIPGVPDEVSDVLGQMDFSAGGAPGGEPFAPEPERSSFDDEMFEEEEEGITSEPWFIPAVIGTGIAGIWFATRKKKR